MTVRTMAEWARRKGISLLGTGDFTHPAHLEDLTRDLRPQGNGLYSVEGIPEVSFMLTAEVSSIYSFGGRVRKVHNLIYAPDLGVVRKINMVLGGMGNIVSDGRPILGLSAKDLIKIVLDISNDCLFVPAHVWTPWFSVFGSKSGFDSLEECFQEYAKEVYAIETGLSSDPAMNWRISGLDRLTLLSNSDAHSPSKLGREANVFDCSMDYYEIMDVIKTKDKSRFLCTIEFFPEEGKYHFDGHRECGISFTPDDTEKHKGICPVCLRGLTVGVMNRVSELADRAEGYIPTDAIGVKHAVPLQEIIASVFGAGVNTKKVRNEYDRITAVYSEFEALLDISAGQLQEVCDERVARGVLRVRAGALEIIPGYDGVFGKVSMR
ncbi:MAG: DNA helicase UvrD [Nitrospira sp.]|nr:DNA helicase UvrD [bacterium]MBL7049184.1 DNA helicase UvrD [Nitrospira sp.]